MQPAFPQPFSSLQNFPPLPAQQYRSPPVHQYQTRQNVPVSYAKPGVSASPKPESMDFDFSRPQSVPLDQQHQEINQEKWSDDKDGVWEDKTVG